MLGRVNIESHAVGYIQGKSSFTVAEGESRNVTVAESRMLLSNKNSVKR